MVNFLTGGLNREEGIHTTYNEIMKKFEKQWDEADPFTMTLEDYVRYEQFVIQYESTYDVDGGQKDAGTPSCP